RIGHELQDGRLDRVYKIVEAVDECLADIPLHLRLGADLDEVGWNARVRAEEAILPLRMTGAGEHEVDRLAGSVGLLSLFRQLEGSLGVVRHLSQRPVVQIGRKFADHVSGDRHRFSVRSVSYEYE